MDITSKFLLIENRKDENSKLFAQNIRFARIVYEFDARSKVKCTIKCLCTKINLETQLQSFWELKEVSQKTPLSLKEAFCEKHYKDSTICNGDSRYIVELSQKYDLSSSNLMGESKQKAVSQQEK